MKTLKDMRLQKNITQADLAKALKISPSTIGMYEQGRRQPDNETLVALAKFFNTSTDFLLGKTTVNKPSNDKYMDKPLSHSLSDEALEIARKYDRVDKRGQGNIKSVVEREYEMTIEGQTEDAGFSL